jgi:hypothetical protein
MPRLLHTAAWKLGERPARLPPEVASRLIEARGSCIEALAAAAHARDVDVVVVSGDLLADNQVGPAALAEARRLLAAFAPLPVHIVAGLRDPAEVSWALGRLGAGQGDLSHVVLHGVDQTVAVAGLSLRMLPLTARRPLNDPTESVEAPGDGCLGVLVTHGRAHGVAVEREVLHQVNAARLKALGWAYLALGGRDDLWFDDAGCGYAGAPEVMRPGRAQLGSALLVEVTAEGCQVEALPIGSVQWIQAKATLGDHAQVEDFVGSLATMRGDLCVVELSLEGALRPTDRVLLDEALAELRERVLFVEVDDMLDLRFEEEDLAGAVGLVADAVALLLAPGDPIGRQATRDLLADMEGA